MLQKSSLKQHTFRNTIEVFSLFKKQLEHTHDDYREKVTTKDPYVTIEFKERTTFEAELRFSGDLLVFSMHTNVFLFDKQHPIYKSKYVSEATERAFCGVIHVYNFLADSYKYNRLNDVGYLMARIFVNRDNHFFVEGRKPIGLLYPDFENQIMDANSAQNIINNCIYQALHFDLLVPPIDQIQVISVGQKLSENGNAGIATGKRVGFKEW